MVDTRASRANAAKRAASSAVLPVSEPYSTCSFSPCCSPSGVAMRKWVTYHGISLNYAVEMERYQAIVPCGLDPVVEPVGSLDRHLGRPIDLRGELVPAVVEAFADVFECDVQRREPPENVL